MAWSLRVGVVGGVARDASIPGRVRCSSWQASARRGSSGRRVLFSIFPMASLAAGLGLSMSRIPCSNAALPDSNNGTGDVYVKIARRVSAVMSRLLKASRTPARYPVSWTPAHPLHTRGRQVVQHEPPIRLCGPDPGLAVRARATRPRRGRLESIGLGAACRTHSQSARMWHCTGP